MKYPSFKALHGRAPIPGKDFDPDAAMCQDDHEYLSGSGQYSDNPKNHYAKHEYPAAKQFLQDNKAEIIGGFVTPSASWIYYRLQDGSEWHEFESKLESPEDGYTLDLAT